MVDIDNNITMKNSIRTLQTMLLIIFSFSILITPVTAQESGVQNNSENARLGNRAETASEERSQRCENASARITEVATNLDESRNRYIARYEAIIQRLSNVERYLTDQGEEASPLLQEIEFLSRQVDEFDSLISQVIRQLAGASEIVCSEDPSDFRQTVVNAKVNLSQARQSARIINAYLADEIPRLLNTFK